MYLQFIIPPTLYSFFKLKGEQSRNFITSVSVMCQTKNVIWSSVNASYVD